MIWCYDMIQLGAIMIRWDAFLPMNVQAKSSVQLFKLNRAYIYNAQPYLTYLPTYLPTNLPSYQPTYLPTYLPTYQPTYLPTYLPTYDARNKAFFR